MSEWDWVDWTIIAFTVVVLWMLAAAVVATFILTVRWFLND